MEGGWHWIQIVSSDPALLHRSQIFGRDGFDMENILHAYKIFATFVSVTPLEVYTVRKGITLCERDVILVSNCYFTVANF